MKKLGFFFLTRDRDVIISCPCCKSYTRFERPESNMNSVSALMKATKDEIYLSYYSNADWQDDSPSINSTSAILMNGRLDSTNISNCSSINPIHFTLKMPYNKAIDVVCPKCGGESTSYNYNPDSKYPTPFYIGSTVTEDYKRIQFNVKGFIFTFFKNKVQTHYYMTRIVFNKYTGRVTILRPLGTDNKPLRLFPEFAKMWNVTYGKFDARGDLNFRNDDDLLIKDMKDNLVPPLLKALQDRFPYIKDDHFDDCFIDHPKPEKKHRRNNRIVHARGINKINFSYVFRNIVRKFRFHDLPTEFLDSFSNQYPKRMKVLSRVGYLSKQQHTDLIKIAGGKLPKSLRKSVLKSFNALLFVRDAKFIKSVSNLNKMIDCYAEVQFNPNDFEPFFHEYMHALMEKNGPNFKNQDKLYEHCETICVNRLTDEGNTYWIQDTYYQLNQIREQGVEYVINTDLTLRQLHDDISSALRKIHTKNKELTYTDKEKEIEWSYGKYIFKLAHDTHYLVDVGAMMNICVGSYGDRAFNKSLHIVTVSSPDNPYECCIEMSADMKMVRQAKTKHNRKPKDNLLEAVMAWVNEKKLEIDTYDLPREEIVEGDQSVRHAFAQPVRLRRVEINEEDENHYFIGDFAAAE